MVVCEEEDRAENGRLTTWSHLTGPSAASEPTLVKDQSIDLYPPQPSDQVRWVSFIHMASHPQGEERTIWEGVHRLHLWVKYDAHITLF